MVKITAKEKFIILIISRIIIPYHIFSIQLMVFGN